MVKNISESLALNITDCVGKKDEQEIYSYGLQILINTIISIGAVLLISICLNTFMETVFFLVCYCSLRIYAGGLHADSNEKCMSIFIIGYLIIQFIITHLQIQGGFFLIFLLVVNMLLIIAWAPIEAHNNPVPTLKRKIMKRNACYIFLILSIVIFVMISMSIEAGFWGIAGVYWFSIIFVAGKIKNEYIRRNER